MRRLDGNYACIMKNKSVVDDSNRNIANVHNEVRNINRMVKDTRDNVDKRESEVDR